jgi:hypothetical protein
MVNDKYQRFFFVVVVVWFFALGEGRSKTEWEDDQSE